MSLLASTPLLAASAVAALALLIWAWWLERAQSRPGWRLGALVAMAACLFLLASQPARQRSVAASSAILLTAGSDPAAVAALDPAVARFALPGAPAGLAEPVADLGSVVRRLPGLRRWLVSGSGLAPWQLSALPGEVTFAAPVLPRPGIERAQWRRRIALGERLAVQGSVFLGDNVAATLRMVGPAGVEVRRDVVGTSAFSLDVVPRRAGRLLYRLELVDADGPLASGNVDVEVTPPQPPRLLWLEGAPGFESREVKAWLRDLGGALVLRTQISRGRFRYDYLNHERSAVARLDAAVLSGFDLMVIDGLAWRALGTSEHRAIDAAVAAGLGLVLVPPLPQSVGAAAPPISFTIEPVADLEEFEVEVEGPGVPPLAPLVTPARHFSRRPGQRALMTDTAGRALAVSAPLALGQVAATLVEGTYRWPLRGEAASHRLYWSRLLAAVARPSRAASASLPAGPILVHRPLTVDLVAKAAETAQVVEPQGEALALNWGQDPLEARHWQATLWPRVTGWHRLTQGDDALAFYVSSSSAWPSWREREAHSATTLRAALGPSQEAPIELESALQPLPRWPLFALLLALWAVLWADERWRGAPPAQ